MYRSYSFAMNDSTSSWTDEENWTRVLGVGAFGVVLHCQGLKSGPPSAVKLTLIEDSDLNGPTVREFLRMKFMNHPNLVRLMEFRQQTLDEEYLRRLEQRFAGQLLENDDFFQMWMYKAKKVGSLKVLHIRMELCSTSLRTWLNEKILDPSEDVVETQRQIVYGVLCGLLYLHSNRIMHRDIRPENILFSGDCGQGRFQLPVKLADFGLCRRFPAFFESTKRSLTESVGNFSYMAPEVGCKEYDQYADYFSTGLTLWETIDIIHPHDIREQFHELVQVGNEGVVVGSDDIPIARDIIIAMTKRLRDTRKESAEALIPAVLPTGEGDMLDCASLKDLRFGLQLAPSNVRLTLRKGALVVHGCIEFIRDNMTISGYLRNNEDVALHFLQMHTNGCLATKLRLEHVGKGNALTNSTLQACSTKKGMHKSCWIRQSTIGSLLRNITLSSGSLQHHSGDQYWVEVQGYGNLVEEIHFSQIPLSAGVKCVLGGHNNELRHALFKSVNENPARENLRNFLLGGGGITGANLLLLRAIYTASHIVCPPESISNVIYGSCSDSVFLAGVGHTMINVKCDHYICCYGEGILLKNCTSPLLLIVGTSTAGTSQKYHPTIEKCEFKEVITLHVLDTKGTLCPNGIPCLLEGVRVGALPSPDVWPSQHRTCKLCSAGTPNEPKCDDYMETVYESEKFNYKTLTTSTTSNMTLTVPARRKALTPRALFRQKKRQSTTHLKH